MSPAFEFKPVYSVVTVRTGQNMNSADSEQLKSALRSQAGRLAQQEDHLPAIQQGISHVTDSQREFESSVTNQINHLAGQVHHLLTHLKAEPSPPPPAGPEANADPKRMRTQRPLPTPCQSVWLRLRSFPGNPMTAVPFW